MPVQSQGCRSGAARARCQGCPRVRADRRRADAPHHATPMAMPRHANGHATRPAANYAQTLSAHVLRGQLSPTPRVAGRRLALAPTLARRHADTSRPRPPVAHRQHAPHGPPPTPTPPHPTPPMPLYPKGPTARHCFHGALHVRHPAAAVICQSFYVGMGARARACARA